MYEWWDKLDYWAETTIVFDVLGVVAIGLVIILIFYNVRGKEDEKLIG